MTIIRQGHLAVTLEKTKVENVKQMRIKYYIESQVCRGIFLDKDLYIESDLKQAPKTFGKASLQEEICRMDLTLFKVSSQRWDEDSSS